MRRFVMFLVLSVALAGALVVAPSQTKPAEAQAVSNSVYVNYGEWNCWRATGRWDKPVRVQVSATPGGPGATRILAYNSWVKLTDIHLRTNTLFVGEIHCPHPNWALRVAGVTQYVGPISATRWVQTSGQNVWI
jgi:hypothetical protein